MTDRHDSNNEQSANSVRRKLAKNALLGGGLIGVAATQNIWTKPVIKSSLLPAHADPSGPIVCEAPTC